MVNLLTIADYGILASLFSITYILLVFTESFQTILAKYSANEEDDGRLKNVFNRSLRKSIKISSLLFIIYLGVALILSSLLKIHYLLISFTGLIIFLTFLLPIPRGIMQGRKKFKVLGLNLIFESIFKLTLGLLLVSQGLRVFGAMTGVILGGFIAFLFSFVQLRDIMKVKEKRAEIGDIYDFTLPTLIVTASVVIFYSLDVVIARIFFPEDLAGAYAIASVLGKIIFWGTLPISKAMFPISTGIKDNKKESKNVFRNSLLILFVGISIVLTAFFLFPDLIVKFFNQGEEIPISARVLFYLGISFGTISLTNLILLYKLSLNKIKRPYFLGFFIVIEIILLSIFSYDLIKFSIAFVIASLAFLLGVVLLFKK